RPPCPAVAAAAPARGRWAAGWGRPVRPAPGTARRRGRRRASVRSLPSRTSPRGDGRRRSVRVDGGAVRPGDVTGAGRRVSSTLRYEKTRRVRPPPRSRDGGALWDEGLTSFSGASGAT